MKNQEIKTVRHGKISFNVRVGTSDRKAYEEVIVNASYQRRDFRIEKGERWIDIGANCGAFSVWAGAQGAKVVAFEPDKESAAMARCNIRQNGLSESVTLHDAGVTEDEEGKSVALYRNTANGNVWRNSMFKKWRGGDMVQVNLIPLHPYWNASTCVKLDAEGLEMPLLEKYAGCPVKKLVAEWSFDIDPSIARYISVVETLKRTYQNVRCKNIPEGIKEWPREWFPACSNIWCW